MAKKHIVLFSVAAGALLVAIPIVSYSMIKASCAQTVRSVLAVSAGDDMARRLRYHSCDFNLRHGLLRIVFSVEGAAFPGDPQLDLGVQWRCLGGDPVTVRLVR